MAPTLNYASLSPEEQQEFDETWHKKSIAAGKVLATPPPGEEIVISGMAGKFPDSDNVVEFQNNLFNKVDMISADERRWAHTYPEIPKRAGKIYNVEKFDAGFFGCHPRHTPSIDPMGRLLIERAYEAIIDAGYHPRDLEGTNTGVYIGSCVSETENVLFFSKRTEDDFALLGCIRSMMANRISYWLKTNGPSYITDTACSSSLYSFEQAYKDLRQGKCDYALVCGANLCLHPYVSLQFARLGVLSPDGRCKSFDNAADGYARSEGICVILLERAKTAKRVYARVLHAKTNCDGFKEQGITYPSGEIQKVLLDDFYKECDIPTNSLSYMEAHGTGTKVGDPEELNTLDQVFCTGRNRPLLIGTVKSNIGHNEPVSGLCSIVKVIIGMERDYIPPNINFNNLREGVEGLENKRLIVVSEKTPWPDNNGLAGINSFGFGGGNSHILLKWNEKLKVDGGLPKDNLPRLICLSGRASDGISNILNDVVSKPLDAEYIALLHNVFRQNIPGHRFRGYSIISKTGGEIVRSEVTYNELNNPELVYAFVTSDKKWPTIGHQLFSIPKFVGTLQKLHDIYQNHDLPVNVTEIINGYKADNLVHYIIGSVSIQLSLVDLLKELKIEHKSSISSSIGSIPMYYAEGNITLEQAALAAYYTSLALTEVIEKPENESEDVNNSKTGQHLIKYLNEFITAPSTSRSNKKTLSEELSQHILSLKSQKYTDDLSKNSIILSIGSGMVKSTKTTNSKEIVLVQPGDKDIVNGFLQNIGRLYEAGFNVQIGNLYPKIQFPVSRGTPYISHLLKWNHDSSWYVMNYKEWIDIFFGYKVVNLNAKDVEWTFVTGHVIDGRNLFPATGYLVLIWNLLASMVKKITQETKVMFENVKFIRAVNIPKNGSVEMALYIQKITGNFEVTEGGVCVVSGRVKEISDDDYKLRPIHTIEEQTQDINIPLDDKDIYKELRLRGYNYSGLFRSLKKYQNGVAIGKIEWKNNFIAFMDCMLQMKILQEDTRNLYVPTGIDRIVIDPASHIAAVGELGENSLIPVYVDKNSGIIRSSSIEISGLFASPIPRKKPAGEPILETYKFTPNIASLSLEQSIRVNMQIALENIMSVKVKVVEVPEEVTDDYKFISPIVSDVLGDLPLMQPELSILYKTQIEVARVDVVDKDLKEEQNCLLLILNNLSQKPETLTEALKSLRDGGFILSRESMNVSLQYPDSMAVFTIHEISDTEKLVLLRKRELKKLRTVIDISDNTENFEWLARLQKSVKGEEDILLVSQSNETSGIMGLVNCIRREPGGDKVKALFVCDKAAPPFSFSDKFYSEQLEKGLAYNVFKEGEWGTYRHLLLPEVSFVDAEHMYAVTLNTGDLSNLKWIEGSLKNTDVSLPEETRIRIGYAALNFRDVMTASGKISVDVITRNRTKQTCVQGFEFSGVDNSGERVFGMVSSGALSNIVNADNGLLWKVPKNWSLAEAATVPCVYATAIAALNDAAKIKAGETILIHAGTGGVGQAAINLALYYGCTVFTTVGTQEKKDYIKKQFPQIDHTHIGNSRDTSFEQMIMQFTNGKGVDVILNSLSEEKLQASVRCLARGGRFIEIGKFDLANNSSLNLEIFEKGASFHSVMLDMNMNLDPFLKAIMNQNLQQAIDCGAVKPLKYTVFKSDELEQAFRFMASGKHMGKVLIGVNDQLELNKSIVKSELVKCLPRYYCDPDKTVIVIGGLGGFGLELSDWLMLRGARKLVLTSRKGVQTGYQSMRISNWKSYGVDVIVSTKDVANKESCLELIEEAMTLGTVQAIFNLGVVLRDSILENQTVEDFKTSFAPKAFATEHLDEITRKLCPDLRDFVIFSSVSCGRGNAGQTNYGMANSVMERVCEKRKRDGFPALAIEWGAIGDVGLVAQMQESNTELVIGGTLQQPISSCLNVLDVFLRQQEPIVSSMVVAEKKSGSFENAIDAIANILGIRDLKVISPHTTLPELGMDSIMAVEIKQILEGEYDIVLTPPEIRSMTFARIKELEKQKESGEHKQKEFQAAAENTFKMLLTNIGPSSLKTADKPFIRLPTLPSNQQDRKTVLFIPGIQGFATILEPLALNLDVDAYCLQYYYDYQPQDIISLANKMFPIIRELLGNRKDFTLVAYSFGVIITLEILKLLEADNYTGKAIFIDGSPEVMKEMAFRNLVMDTDALFETSVLCNVLGTYIPHSVMETLKIKMLQCNSYDERIQLGLDNVPSETPYPLKFLENLGRAFCERIRAIISYQKSFDKLKTPCKLLRPKEQICSGFEEDYKLGVILENFEEIVFLEGDHVSVLENLETAQHIHKFFEIEK